MTRDDYLHAIGIDIWRKRLSNATVPNYATLTDSTETWEQLEAKAKICTACHLHTSRKHVVFGSGSQTAELLIIGEAPGAQEDQEGSPFVGEAGQLLTKMLLAIGLKREEVYIANIIKCRPPKNRDPSIEEITTCTPYLIQQIKLLKPKIILALGRIAAQFLLNSDQSISKLRGKIFHYGTHQIPLIVTYHPAYLLRSPTEKRKSWEDLKLLQQQLQR